MIAVLTYLACIALWALSTILMIWKKFPWCALFLFLLHLWELLTVGLKTGSLHRQLPLLRLPVVAAAEETDEERDLHR